MKCQQCDKEFKPTRNSLGKFCSRKCMGLSYKKRKEVKCSECRKNFEILESRFKKSNFFFCSRKCKDKAQSLDGNCKDILPLHYGKSNKRWGNSHKKKAFNHKEKICEGCGEDKEYLLVIHHKDGNRFNGKLENLEIVCSNCHIKRHLQTKGKKIIYRTNILTSKELFSQV